MQDRKGRGVGIAATAGVVVLLALHLDVWRPIPKGIYLGWIPEELLFRLAWMVLAWLYLVWFARFVWREEDGEDGSEER